MFFQFFFIFKALFLDISYLNYTFTYLTTNFIKFVDIIVSIKHAKVIINSIIKLKIACLIISNFILDTFLSFTIVLYNFIPLTAIPNKAGIINIFCNNNEDIINIIPLFVPTILVIKAIVYPKRKTFIYNRTKYNWHSNYRCSKKAYRKTIRHVIF